MKLLFATGNAGKVKELRRLFAELPLELLTPADVGGVPEVVEDRETFAGNAEKKAREIAAATGHSVLADDSGLEVDALGGVPGVHSAYYAGPSATDAENNRKLLDALQEIDARGAQFRCILAFFDPTGPLGNTVHFEDGLCRGTIALGPKGDGGFGYDPLFVPEGETRRMAELPPDEKGAISHRGRASRKMADYLERYLSGRDGA
ncbi:MAG: RdgB/HAM1 family non-canonical purine NTP pyrophosphatase [Myxococcota bacterium]